MIPEVTHEEYLAEIKRITNGEPGWSSPAPSPLALAESRSQREIAAERSNMNAMRMAEQKKAEQARLIQMMADCYQNGLSCREIAEHFNRTDSGVYQILRRHRPEILRRKKCKVAS